MDPPKPSDALRDSIDGLGFTIQDLKPEQQIVALYRRTTRTLSDAERAILKAALVKAKQTSDANQQLLRALTQEQQP